jgi:hypothetical protein
MKGCEKERLTIRKMKEQIRKLKEELSIHRGLGTRMTGTTGEDFIKRLSPRSMQIPHDASFDILTKGGVKIEVKTVRCLPANNKNLTPCFRWSWRYVIGHNKEKDYDYLILIGDKDKRYNHNDKDKTPYIYFLLTKKQVKQILYPDDAHGQINLTTNFDTVRSKQGRALLKHRKSFTEIKAFLKKV